ncbi:M23 family metallopeptidase [Polycladomyces abyssicola]|nr:M23 family metallopeptidase [Polycladomyces abyssicola]
MRRFLAFCMVMSLTLALTFPSAAAKNPHAETDWRKQVFKNVEMLTGLPWYYLAAMDQYERNLQKVRRDLPRKKGWLAIHIPAESWAGVINPDQEDNMEVSIHYFGGIGRDGNGDGKANRHDPVDVLYTVARFLSQLGTDEDAIRTGLWRYYHQPIAVDTITHIAKIFAKFDTLKLDAHVFPIPLQYNYTYHSTWGDRRGWGGLRIHEGTDIFANYGTPVLSTCYGYIELMGWNKYGGWRLGIRDVYNNYHYYAHLNGFRKKLKQGDIVKPGDVVGYVGSSGYGPPGTSGKFPPHLHYGLYKFNGRTIYSFDPYPHLKAWERQTRKQLREMKQKMKQKMKRKKRQ